MTPFASWFAAASGGRTMPAVLVVDDNEMARRLIASPLAAVGFTVETASGGHEALRMFRPGHHQVVITDILMAEGEGIGLIRSLLESDPDLPILAVSADARAGETSSLAMATKVGARGTLAKPFSTHDLLASVGALIDGGGQAALA